MHDGVTAAALMGRREFGLLMMAAAPERARREMERAEPRIGPGLELSRKWHDSVCSIELKNRSAAPVLPHEIVVFEWRHSLPAASRIYGEGFQMLSQTGGTLASPVPLGGYEDAQHYRIAKPQDATTVYSILLLSPAESQHILLAFTSARRFVGRFHLRPGLIQVTCDLEGLAIEPGETLRLEDFTVLEGNNRDVLLRRLAELVRSNHSISLPSTPPRGWCSWVAFGDKVTSEGVIANARAAKERAPSLRYIQIDGGYMQRLGDWFEPSQTFRGSVKDTLRQVRDLGLEPALWLAPFIAEKTSRIFAQHPTWFVRDDSGAPLPADRVTYGGWKRPPWFALDGTNPEVQEHLERVFRTLHEEWGATYFKLDANFWGAMHGGRFHDPKATRVEAYRRGMQAIRRGAGNAFLLGCNHPMWPSLGLIHGSRSSNDIEPKWSRVKETSTENLSRLWQNGRLWWNDPDTTQFAGSLSSDELDFHFAVLHAARGLVMSSDDLSRLTPEQRARLKILAAAAPGEVEFDSDFRQGRSSDSEKTMIYLLNWDDAPSERRLPEARSVRDLWTQELITTRQLILPPRSARVFLVG